VDLGRHPQDQFLPFSKMFFFPVAYPPLFPKFCLLSPLPEFNAKSSVRSPLFVVECFLEPLKLVHFDDPFSCRKEHGDHFPTFLSPTRQFFLLLLQSELFLFTHVTINLKRGKAEFPFFFFLPHRRQAFSVFILFEHDLKAGSIFPFKKTRISPTRLCATISLQHVVRPTTIPLQVL